MKAVNVKLDLSMKEIKIIRINKIGTIRILPCLDLKKKKKWYVFMKINQWFLF